MGTRLLFDGRSMPSEADFHEVIDGAARAVGFYGYGRNLDALWDVLTRMLEPPVKVHWVNASAARLSLGQRFEQILQVLQDAEEELGSEFQLEVEP